MQYAYAILTVASLTLFWLVVFYGIGNLIFKRACFFESVLMGMFVAMIFGMVANFFFPLLPHYSTVGSGLLFILGLIRIAQCRPKLLVSDIMLGACIVLVAPLMGTMYDSALYHYPQIKWLLASPLPKGLAHVNERFAYNSQWFILSALMHTSQFGIGSAFTVNVVFFFAFSGFFLSRLRNETNQELKIFSLVVLCLCLYPMAMLKDGQLANPSTDIAASGTLLITAFFLLRKTILNNSEDAVFALLMLTFSILIKSSIIPTAFCFLIFFLFYSYTFNRKLVAALVFSGLCLALHMLKNFWISGCLVFPLAISCDYSRSWSLSESTVARAKYVLQTFNRGSAASDLSWVLPRMIIDIRDGNFILLAAAMAVLSCSVLAIYKRRLLKPQMRFWFLLVGILLTWWWSFYNSPDLRFQWVSYALLIILAAILFNLNFAIMAKFPRSTEALPKWVIFYTAATTLVFISLNSPRKISWPVENLAIDKNKWQTHTNAQGVTFYAGNENCGTAPLPCMEYFNPNIRAMKSEDGRYFLLFSMD